MISDIYTKVDNRSRQVEIDMENLDTYRNDDTPTQLIKHEVLPGKTTNNQSNAFVQW